MCLRGALPAPQAISLRARLGLSLARQFHMADDSGLFNPPEYFSDDEFDGWSYRRDSKE